MAAKRNIFLPPQFALHTGLFGNPIRQLFRPAELHANVSPEKFTHRNIQGEATDLADGRRIVVVPRRISAEPSHEVLLVPTGKFLGSSLQHVELEKKIKWLVPANLKKVGTRGEAAARCADAVASWAEEFDLRAESIVAGNKVDGLRPPQIGAIHAVLSHWTIGYDPATIIMPTGTGKTETMLVLLAKERLEKVLVVVPTDPLRPNGYSFSFRRCRKPTLLTRRS